MYKVFLTDRSYEWWCSRLDLMRRNIRKYPLNYETEFMQMFEELEGALLSAQQERDPRQAKEPKEPKAEEAKPKAPRKPAVPIRDGCEDHPTYGGQRRPQRDCAACWALYKKLNPMNYAKARRDFERKNRT